MSFYGLYMIKDQNDMGHIKIKKLKYQLRNAHERIVQLKSKNEKQEKSIDELK